MAVHAPRIAEKCIIWTQAMIDQALFNEKLKRPVKICFDEWNVWNADKYPGTEGHEEIYNVSDMLGVAVWLNIFNRHADIVEIACIAQSVNVIAPIYTKPGDLMKQTIWWPYQLTAQNVHGRSVATHVNCSMFEGEVTGQLEKFADMLPELKHLDVASTVDDSNILTISIVNGKLEPVEVDLQIDSEIKHGIEKYEVVGNPEDDNSFEAKDKVIPIQSSLSSSTTVILKRCSYTMLRYQL